MIQYVIQRRWRVIHFGLRPRKSPTSNVVAEAALVCVELRGLRCDYLCALRLSSRCLLPAVMAAQYWLAISLLTQQRRNTHWEFSSVNGLSLLDGLAIVE